MAFTDAAINSMFASIVGKASPNHTITHLSLHTGDPSTTGANEVTGNGYARVGVTEADFDMPSLGQVITNNDKMFNGPANQVITHAGIWDGTTWLGSGTLSGDFEFNSSGEFTLLASSKLISN